jgi:hypothetical protein
VTCSPLAAPITRGAGQLEQYLLSCPACAKPGAAHVDWGESDVADPVLVRFVCPDGCPVDAATVLALIEEPPSALTA